MKRLSKIFSIGNRIEIHLNLRIWDINYSDFGYKRSRLEIRFPHCDVLTAEGWKHCSYEFHLRIYNYEFTFEYRLKKYADIMPF